jgi:hypothetical protein
LTACHVVFFISLSVYFGQFEFYIVFLFFADMSYGGGSMVARNEWLEMLITHLCLIEEQCFPLLFTELGIPRTATQHLPQQPEAPLSHKLETKLPSKEQASLLEILCVWIEEDGGKAREETVEGGGDNSKATSSTN